MAKGQIAKNVVEEKIRQIFGTDFLGTYDKKLYVQAEENGEKIQIAISMTCPKTPVEFTSVATSGFVQTSGDWNFDDEPAATVTTTATAPAAPVEITQEERNNIAELMARLGL